MDRAGFEFAQAPDRKSCPAAFASLGPLGHAKTTIYQLIYRPTSRAWPRPLKNVLGPRRCPQRDQRCQRYDLFFEVCPNPHAEQRLLEMWYECFPHRRHRT